jgi:pyruvate dehydrogenase E2 component (dihydrolipoamide acetyltransferase)
VTLKNIVTPDLGGAAEVSVIEILVKPGDTVEIDTPIVTLESDKATMEIPSSDAGVIKELKVKVGDTISAGAVLVVLEATGAKAAGMPGDAGVVSSPVQKPEPAKVEAPKTEAAKVAVLPVSAISEEEEDDGDVHAGPGVRRLAYELGVALSAISGSGPKQRILREDVHAFVKSQLTQKATGGVVSATLPVIDFSQFGPIESEPLSRIQKISGKNLQRNWTMIPHVTQFGQADITGLEEFRQAQKSELEKQKIKLTPLVFIMKGVVASLKAFPRFNASLDTSGEQLILKKFFHIGVAVDTPDGLVVPVIRDVDKKGLIELAVELAAVSEKARRKQLTPQDMQGGCFSISSLGGIGGTAFTPIINYPEVAILGVSKSSYQPVYQEGVFVPRLMLPLSLSYDHRVIDGALGARFIIHLTDMLSDIRNLLM